MSLLSEKCSIVYLRSECEGSAHISPSSLADISPQQSCGKSPPGYIGNVLFPQSHIPVLEPFSQLCCNEVLLQHDIFSQLLAGTLGGELFCKLVWKVCRLFSVSECNSHLAMSSI